MNLLYAVQNETYKAVRGFEDLAQIKRDLSEKCIALTAVKNQSAAFQVVFFSGEDFLLSVTGSTGFDKSGMIPVVRLAPEPASFGGITGSMNILGFVEDDDMLQKADILLNDENVHVEKRKLQPVWVEYPVPEAAEPGVYEGVLGIYLHTGFGPEERIGEVAFSIDVRDITLPAPEDYAFYLDLWQHNANIARKHEVKLWSDSHFEIIENYVASLSGLGQKAISVIASEIPWSGQFGFKATSNLSDLYEYNMIRVFKDAGGKLGLDFGAVDRYIDLCFKYGIKEEIELFGLLNIWVSPEEGFGKVIDGLSDSIRVRYLDLRDNRYYYIDNADDLRSYISAIEKHFINRGLIDRVRIIADEPADPEENNKRLEFLAEAAPSLKYKVALAHAEFLDAELPENIVDFVPVIFAIGNRLDRYLDIRKKTGGKICWYVCCTPDIPNTFIKSYLLESWFIGWFTEYIGFDGFLRWNYTVWPENPRQSLRYRAHVFPTGDMNFVYPSPSGGPLLSLRYKALLRGIQIFELLNMLKKAGGNAGELIAKAREKIFRFKSIDVFQADNNRRFGELASIEYRDHAEALDIILRAIAVKDEE